MWEITIWNYPILCGEHFYQSPSFRHANIDILLSIFYRRFPFDVKSLSGYLISFILQYIMISISIFFVSSILSLLIGSDFMLTISTKDLRCELNAVDESVKHGEDCVRIIKRFSGFIEFHAESKQLSEYFDHLLEHEIELILFRLVHMFSELFQPNAILIVLWGVTAIANSMLMLQLEIVPYFPKFYFTNIQNLDFAQWRSFCHFQTHHTTNNSMILLTVVYYVCWSFWLVHFICEIGEHIRCEFDEINNAIVESEWYSFPFEVKRTLPTILYNTQKPVCLECFGSSACSRTVFKAVSN